MSNQTLLQEEQVDKTTTDTPCEPLKLTPALGVEIDRFIANKQLAFDLVNGLGSPLNVLLPDQLAPNVISFQDVFDKYRLIGSIFFAHKTNRSGTILKRLSLEKVGVDVASVTELKHALSCGFASNRIEATGPKNRDFLSLALAHDIVLNVDSVAELETIVQLKKGQYNSCKTKILLRFSHFKNKSKYSNKASRFGLCASEIENAFKILVEQKETLTLIGFAFHLDTINVLEKAFAVEQCFELFEEALACGFMPYVLNIGGGFKLNYLANQSDWHNYTTALREAVMGARPAITWQGNSFGLKAENNALRGSFNSYNYYDPSTGPNYLVELLEQTLPNRNGMSIATFLRDNSIQLWIEPGRSLVDQVGLTIGKVASIRRSSQGDCLVCLEMKRQDLCFLDQEFFVDPIILYGDARPEKADLSIPVYFAGNLCLESDLIYRHQTFLNKLPQAGDLVVFPNTAGYFMDFSACEAIMHPRADKVAVYKNNERLEWTRDDQYQPRCSQV
jgi:diaminopimelate decarboxylase